MTDRYSIPGCRAGVEIVYLDHGICAHHWDRLTAENQPADALARALGIPVAKATTTEKTMSDETTTAAETAATEETMPAKKTAKPRREAKTKTAKGPKPAKTAKAKPPKQPEAKKESGPKPERVFAIRITTPELVALHKAAGPRNATRLVRALTAAFVNEDAAAFGAIVKEARELRG